MGPKTLVVLSFCMVRIKATRNQKKKCIPCMVSYNWIYLFIYYAVSSMLHPCTSFPCILHENFAVQLLFSIFNVATLQLLRFPCNKMTFLIEAIHILIQPSVCGYILYQFSQSHRFFLCRYPKTSAWDIMFGMNLWGTIYNMVYMFGWPHGSGFEAVQFCRQHPEAAWDIFLFCLCGAVGQNFIFLTISQFGSLTNTTITTTRKFVSIVVSSLLSGNPLSAKQWGSVSMVFSGLSYQIYLKWKRGQRLHKKRKPMWRFNDYKLYIHLFTLLFVPHITSLQP